jgi:hypothetical protein
MVQRARREQNLDGRLTLASRKSRTCSSDFPALPSGLEAQLLERGPTLQASVEVVEERPLRIGLTAQRWRAAD